jgi:hypothetical protein
VTRLRRRGTASNRGAYTVQTSMGMGFAMVTEEEGIPVTSAEVGGFTVSELRFPKSYVQPPFEPELPYIAVVLEGALVKSFPRQALGRSNAVTIPVGATHGARFGSSGALIVIVRSRSASEPVAGCVDRVAELRARELTRLGLCARRDRRSPRDPGRNRAKIGGIVTQSVIRQSPSACSAGSRSSTTARTPTHRRISPAWSASATKPPTRRSATARICLASGPGTCRETCRSARADSSRSSGTPPKGRRPACLSGL